MELHAQATQSIGAGDAELSDALFMSRFPLEIRRNILRFSSQINLMVYRQNELGVTSGDIVSAFEYNAKMSPYRKKKIFDDSVMQRCIRSYIYKRWKNRFCKSVVKYVSLYLRTVRGLLRDNESSKMYKHIKFYYDVIGDDDIQSAESATKLLVCCTGGDIRAILYLVVNSKRLVTSDQRHCAMCLLDIFFRFDPDCIQAIAKKAIEFGVIGVIKHTLRRMYTPSKTRVAKWITSAVIYTTAITDTIVISMLKLYGFDDFDVVEIVGDSLSELVAALVHQSLFHAFVWCVDQTEVEIDEIVLSAVYVCDDIRFGGVLLEIDAIDPREYAMGCAQMDNLALFKDVYTKYSFQDVDIRDIVDACIIDDSVKVLKYMYSQDVTCINLIFSVSLAINNDSVDAFEFLIELCRKFDVFDVRWLRRLLAQIDEENIQFAPSNEYDTVDAEDSVNLIYLRKILMSFSDIPRRLMCREETLDIVMLLYSKVPAYRLPLQRAVVGTSHTTVLKNMFDIHNGSDISVLACAIRSDNYAACENMDSKPTLRTHRDGGHVVGITN